jgi:hypothetical protein
MKSLEDRARNIAVVSSGDPEKDRAEIMQAALHQSRMDENVCPNGCGQMIFLDPYTRKCEACGFVGFSTRAFDGAKTA